MFNLFMISESGTKSSITADTAFRKDLTLQGCTKLKRHIPRYTYFSPHVPSAHCLRLALFQGKPAEWGAATAVSSIKSTLGSSVRGPKFPVVPPPWTPVTSYTPSSLSSSFSSIFFSTHAQMESQTRGPMDRPSQDS